MLRTREITDIFNTFGVFGIYLKKKQISSIHLPAGGITGGTGTSFCFLPKRNPPFFLAFLGALKQERICEKEKFISLHSRKF